MGGTNGTRLWSKGHGEYDPSIVAPLNGIVSQPREAPLPPRFFFNCTNGRKHNERMAPGKHTRHPFGSVDSVELASGAANFDPRMRQAIETFNASHTNIEEPAGIYDLLKVVASKHEVEWESGIELRCLPESTIKAITDDWSEIKMANADGAMDEMQPHFIAGNPDDFVTACCSCDVTTPELCAYMKLMGMTRRPPVPFYSACQQEFVDFSDFLHLHKEAIFASASYIQGKLAVLDLGLKGPRATAAKMQAQKERQEESQRKKDAKAATAAATAVAAAQTAAQKLLDKQAREARVAQEAQQKEEKKLEKAREKQIRDDQKETDRQNKRKKKEEKEEKSHGSKTVKKPKATSKNELQEDPGDTYKKVYSNKKRRFPGDDPS